MASGPAPAGIKDGFGVLPGELLANLKGESLVAFQPKRMAGAERSNQASSTETEPLRWA